MTTQVKCLDCGIESEPCTKCPVCGRVQHPLDAATNATTAFRTWAEFVAAMRGDEPGRQAYTPTIYQETRRKRLITRAVRAAGFKVYVGGGRWAK